MPVLLLCQFNCMWWVELTRERKRREMCIRKSHGLLKTNLSYKSIPTSSSQPTMYTIHAGIIHQPKEHLYSATAFLTPSFSHCWWANATCNIVLFESDDKYYFVIISSNIARPDMHFCYLCITQLWNCSHIKCWSCQTRLLHCSIDRPNLAPATPPICSCSWLMDFDWSSVSCS
jgi:hypothetical protein